jgi:hypothetical protein
MEEMMTNLVQAVIMVSVCIFVGAVWRQYILDQQDRQKWRIRERVVERGVEIYIQRGNQRAEALTSKVFFDTGDLDAKPFDDRLTDARYRAWEYAVAMNANDRRILELNDKIHRS